MAAKIYDKIPIVDTARRCGLVLDSRTLRRKEVEASCPFCGDHGPGKYHLSLNTDTDQYRCNLCGAHGNSVSLYARIKGICNKEAYLELAHESKVYPLPQSPSPQTQERQPCSLEQRHAVYSDMLAHLTLLPKHGENLLERGLSEERIRRNEYRSMPETERGRRLLADLLRSHGHDLHGIPGFRTYYGDWTLSGPNGFLIPVRNKDGLIQGLKIRLDDAQQANRKYRWLSSRNLPSGTRSYSWVHVTGNTQSKRAFLTEGPLKGDVASFLAQDALFICIGGVNALNGLNDTIRSLGVREVVDFHFPSPKTSIDIVHETILAGSMRTPQTILAQAYGATSTASPVRKTYAQVSQYDRVQCLLTKSKKRIFSPITKNVMLDM